MDSLNIKNKIKLKKEKNKFFWLPSFFVQINKALKSEEQRGLEDFSFSFSFSLLLFTFLQIKTAFEFEAINEFPIMESLP